MDKTKVEKIDLYIAANLSNVDRSMKFLELCMHIKAKKKEKKI